MNATIYYNYDNTSYLTTDIKIDEPYIKNIFKEKINSNSYNLDKFQKTIIKAYLAGAIHFPIKNIETISIHLLFIEELNIYKTYTFNLKE